jgi:hypothetical protein
MLRPTIEAATPHGNPFLAEEAMNTAVAALKTIIVIATS